MSSAQRTLDEADHLRLLLALERERRSRLELECADLQKRLLLEQLTRKHSLSDRAAIDAETGAIVEPPP